VCVCVKRALIITGTAVQVGCKYLSSALGFFLRGSTRNLHRGSEGCTRNNPGGKLGRSGGLVSGRLCNLGLVGGVLGVVACLLLIRVGHLIGLTSVEGSFPGIQLE
jgi:hypothetical protein